MFSLFFSAFVAVEAVEAIEAIESAAATRNLFQRFYQSRTGGYFTWTVIILATGFTVNTVNEVVKDYYIEKREEKFMRRRKIDCKSNNAGCIDNRCWANCGPRSSSDDWCFTSSQNRTELDVKYNRIYMTSCDRDEECDPCWPCSLTCIAEEQFPINIGSINNKTNVNSKIVSNNNSSIKSSG